MLQVIDILLFIPIAFSIGYIFIFAILSLLHSKHTTTPTQITHRFLVIFPAYAEDQVITDAIGDFLRQEYGRDHFDVVVVSDHMLDETNERLKALPINLLIATYENSSKAKALQLTISKMGDDYDYVIILDADNKVDANFLSRINNYCTKDTIAIQAHRQAKNLNTPVALLDAVSEEINNSIFRKGHSNISMSAALIGSGMCIEYNWFKEHVFALSTSGEDKELEEALLLEGKHIEYLEDIPVYDEKVQNGKNFGNQRKRWIAAQIYALKSLAKNLPKATREKRIDYIDKFIQQLLLPRSICIVLVPVITIAVILINHNYAIKWITVCLMLLLALLIAIPKKFYNKRTLLAAMSIPGLVCRMIANLLHLKGANQNFIHTQHGVDENYK